MYPYRCLANCLLAVVLPLVAPDAVAQEPFTLTAAFSNRIAVTVAGRPPLVEVSSGALDRSLTGTEKSQCKDYGRASSSVANAQGQLASRVANSVSLRLSSSVISQGGHYRTCVQCVAGNCVGLTGNDTSSSAQAVTSARLKIEFDGKLLYNIYDLKIASAGEKKLFAVAITSPAGLVTTLGESDAGVYRINAEPGDVYYVDLTLSASSANSGGCCSDQSGGNIEATIRLDKAPILNGLKDIEPFIVGGAPTKEYKAVVAILIDGQTHCSGTVIGSRTILTAAHCIYGYEQLVHEKKMSFVGGSIVTEPSYSGQVVAYDYPRGPDIKFNPRYDSLEHDVGLLYTNDTLAEGVPPLHEGNPNWADIVRKKPLYFVGFGLTKAGGALVGGGVKREAPWNIDAADEWRFYYNFPKKSTCKGDSGGPTFIDVGSDAPMILAGITSGGDANCTRGMSTRVDAYKRWLSSRVK